MIVIIFGLDETEILSKMDIVYSPYITDTEKC